MLITKAEYQSRLDQALAVIEKLKRDIHNAGYKITSDNEITSNQTIYGIFYEVTTYEHFVPCLGCFGDMTKDKVEINEEDFKFLNDERVELRLKHKLIAAIIQRKEPLYMERKLQNSTFEKQDGGCILKFNENAEKGQFIKGSYIQIKETTVKELCKFKSKKVSDLSIGY